MRAKPLMAARAPGSRMASGRLHRARPKPSVQSAGTGTVITLVGARRRAAAGSPPRRGRRRPGRVALQRHRRGRLDGYHRPVGGLVGPGAGLDVDDRPGVAEGRVHGGRDARVRPPVGGVAAADRVVADAAGRHPAHQRLQLGPRGEPVPAGHDELRGAEGRGQAGRMGRKARARVPIAARRCWSSALASRRRCSRSGRAGSAEVMVDHLAGGSTGPRESSTGGW